MALSDLNACIGRLVRVTAKTDRDSPPRKGDRQEWELLAEFLSDQNLRVESSFFTKKLSKKCSLLHPRTKNLLKEYCLTPRNRSYRIQEVRCSWSHSANSDYAMSKIIARGNMKSSIKKSKRGEDTRSKVWHKCALITNNPKLLERLKENSVA